jgi:molecular chaperone IbpA
MTEVTVIDIQAYDLVPYNNSASREVLAGDGYPSYNIRGLNNENYSLELAIPGYSYDDLDITIHGNNLTVKGKLKDSNFVGTLQYQGINLKTFVRRFILPDDIKVTWADLYNGLLLIALHRIKLEDQPPQKIEISVNGRFLTY